MRTIERKMIAAIRDGKNLTLGNTSVIHDPVIGATECEVRLHGNLIAKHILRTGWTMSLAGWGSTTTTQPSERHWRRVLWWRGVWPA